MLQLKQHYLLKKQMLKNLMPHAYLFLMFQFPNVGWQPLDSMGISSWRNFEVYMISWKTSRLRLVKKIVSHFCLTSSHIHGLPKLIIAYGKSHVVVLNISNTALKLLMEAGWLC